MLLLDHESKVDARTNKASRKDNENVDDHLVILINMWPDREKENRKLTSKTGPDGAEAIVAHYVVQKLRGSTRIGSVLQNLQHQILKTQRWVMKVLKSKGNLG